MGSKHSNTIIIVNQLLCIVSNHELTVLLQAYS